MTRPLLISDCDEVILHMVSHFGAWLGEAHQIDFAPDGGDFSASMRRRGDPAPLSREEMWPLLDGFFATEMHRQTLVPHAAEALARIGAVADIVILTNLGEHCHADRVAQLDAHGISHRVVCNQGGKGRPVARLLEEYQPSAAIFIDDLAMHHESVAKHAASVWRLHMISEPSLAPNVPQATHADARIDDWSEALPWILDRLSGLTAKA
ncbi:MAG: HAD family hydrolase [Sphingosinicella sp.]|nr:HAD family hydrolase [Sphingosinicella sp.]